MGDQCCLHASLVPHVILLRRQSASLAPLTASILCELGSKGVYGECSSSCLLQESRGAHAREDFKERDDKHWMKHTVGYYDRPNNKVDISYRRVHDQPLDSEMNHIPPKARTY